MRRIKRPFGKGVNETIDESVVERWSRDPDYRPGSLASRLRSEAAPAKSGSMRRAA